jgi:CheY-like chemotaxis protein
MSSLEKVVVPKKILVVDDEKIARRGLADLLRAKGYRVAVAETGSRAILKARSGRIGVVLMDSGLAGDSIDGITAAQEIQRLYPLTSIIFTTAHAHNLSYLRRIVKSGVRVAGLLDKPVDMDDLERLIEVEFEKLRFLSWLEEVRDLGGDPKEHLLSKAGSLSTDLLRALLADLESLEEFAPDGPQREELLPLAQDAEEEAFMEIPAEIDAVYDQIRSAVAAQQPGKGLKQALRPLRSRLEQLQQRQADALERHVRRRLQFDPERGRQVAERAEELLRRK